MKYEIYNLFSKTIYINILEDISDKELLKIKNYIENLSYSSTSYDVTEKKHTKQLHTSSSLSKSILNNTELFFLKKRIMLEFNYFKNNILKYENNEFSYTTSWIAKSTKNQSSEYHNHNNCMFSGIFYFNTEENCGELCFENKKDDIFHGYPDGLTLQDWLNKVETLYQSNIKIDTADGNNIWVQVDSDGNILDFTHFNWVGSFNS